MKESIIIFVITTSIILSTFECAKINKCLTKDCISESKVLSEKIDTSVDPCDNFYMFACGNYLNGSNTDEEQPSVATAYTLQTNKNAKMLELLNETISDGDIEPFKNVKKLFQACMNEDAIEKLSLKPVKKIISSLGGWPAVQGSKWKEVSWQDVLFNLLTKFIERSPIFELTIDNDLMKSTERILVIDQPKLELAREHLIKGINDEKVEAYLNYQVESAVLFGADEELAREEMRKVVELEIKLAKLAIPDEDRKNITSLCNPIKINDLQELFPIFDWCKYLNKNLQRNDITPNDKIVITDFKNIIYDVYALLYRTPNRVIVNYLIWTTIKPYAVYLNDEMRKADLKFESAVNDKDDYDERWQECVAVVIEQLPIASNALYARSFDSFEDKKQAVSRMVESIRDELKEILYVSEWIDDETRTMALHKLNNIKVQIGHPSEYLDDDKLTRYYNGLKINENYFFKSLLNIWKFQLTQSANEFRTQYDRSNWMEIGDMTSVDVDSSADSTFIEIPLGIMQDEYFDVNLPKYLNYGALGSEFSRVLLFAFGKEGSQFDLNENFEPWWSEDTKRAYEEEAKCFVKQYESIKDPETELNLNGNDTLRQNIDDNGGIRLTYNAYMQYIQDNGEEGSLPNLKYTSNQLFWIKTATSWCITEGPTYMEKIITVDKATPYIYRLNTQFMNMPEFSLDFNCPDNSKMNPENYCKLW